WVSTRSWHSRARAASDRAPRALPSRRLWREQADSACHRRPYTRRWRLPPGLFRNRLTLWRRFLVLGPFRPCARRLRGMTGGPAAQSRAAGVGGRLRADQAAVNCGRGGAPEEADDPPFFSSREAA